MGRSISEMYLGRRGTAGWALLLIWCGAVALSASPARACSIPVFRYALERWPADNYRAVIFHRGPMDPNSQAVVDWLTTAAGDDAAAANIKVRTVDLDGELDVGTKALWQGQVEPMLPWMVVQYPGFAALDEAVWAGTVDMRAAEALVDSPKRRQIARLILSGESVVWVLLACGDREKDEAAFKLLGRQLDKLQKTLKLEAGDDFALPEDFYDDWSESSAPRPTLPLRVAFSQVRVSRDDPAERMFVKMLLGSEKDLKTFAEPMVFPIYGRGRVLCALVGKGINDANIQDVCEFLTGWCSCDIKEQNPGTDMLMRVDWQARAVAAPQEPVAAVVGKVEPGRTHTPGGALVRNMLVALGLMVVVIVLLVLRISRRSSRS